MGSCCSAALASGARRPRRPSSGAWSRSSRRGWPPWAPAAWDGGLRCPSARALRERRCGNSCRSSTHRALPARSRSGRPWDAARAEGSTRSRSEPGLRHTRTSAARLVTDVMVIVVLGTAPLACRCSRSSRTCARPEGCRGQATSRAGAELARSRRHGADRGAAGRRARGKGALDRRCGSFAAGRGRHRARYGLVTGESAPRDRRNGSPPSSRACASSRNCPHATASFAGDRGWAPASRSMLAARGPSGATPALAGRP